MDSVIISNYYCNISMWKILNYLCELHCQSPFIKTGIDHNILSPFHWVKLVINWEYTKFGQHCDIQRIGTKFGVISELEFVLNSTLLKVHVSKWYRKHFSTLLNYGLMRGKIRSFDCENDFLDLPWRIYTFFSQYFF